MQHILQQTAYFGVIYGILLLAVYSYGRKPFPKLAAQLTSGAWVALVATSFYSAILAGLIAVALIIGLLYILRRPDSTRALRQFYVDNKIYTVTHYLPDVLDALGEKRWRYAEGVLFPALAESTKYFFWRGYTSANASAGQYGCTTTFTHYLAFIFPPDSVSEQFKQRAHMAMDKSGYSLTEKVKFFFTPDTDKPCTVTTAEDGSFIIEFFTQPDVAHYAKQLNWIRQNYAPVKTLSAAHCYQKSKPSFKL